MKELLRSIIKEELEVVMSNKYSQEEVQDAIFKKYFIHDKSGNVYSPVELDKGMVVGVNSDCEHVNIPLDEVELIQKISERFTK